MGRKLETIQVQHLTPPVPGAVAVLSLRGPVQDVLDRCTPPLTCEPGEVRLASIDTIDTALVACLELDHLLLMPHGGPAIVRRVLTWIGGHVAETPALPYRDRVEQAMCTALPSAGTTLALDLLLAQGERWRAFDDVWTDADDERSVRLNRLLQPPLVALVGNSNIGKSTLLNALAGRQRALVHDAPGTTRDHVGALLNLGGLVVEWIDTPGLRETDDPVEEQAIALAMDRLRDVDCCIAAADASSHWPQLDRPIDLRLALRNDLGSRTDADCSCSALNDDGLDAVVEAVRTVLVPNGDLQSTRPWLLPGLQRPIAE